MKLFNIIFGLVFISIGFYTLMTGKISLKGNVVNLEYLTYPVSFLLIGFGLFILYLIYKEKSVEL